MSVKPSNSGSTRLGAPGDRTLSTQGGSDVFVAQIHRPSIELLRGFAELIGQNPQRLEETVRAKGCKARVDEGALDHVEYLSRAAVGVAGEAEACKPAVLRAD